MKRNWTGVFHLVSNTLSHNNWISKQLMKLSDIRVHSVKFTLQRKISFVVQAFDTLPLSQNILFNGATEPSENILGSVRTI